VDALAYPQWRCRLGNAGTVSCALGLASLAWLLPALWPNAGWPAWPSVSLGAMALFVSRRPGPAGLRAVASLCGVLGLLLGSLQIAVLACTALFAP
jgi:hypothetical protein